MSTTDDLRAFRDIIRDILLKELLPHVLSALKANERQKEVLLSRSDAAKLLGVSIQTVAKLIRLKQLPSVKVQRRTMIRQSDLAVLVTARDKQNRSAS
jgi:excisionase family DNA binding protein